MTKSAERTESRAHINAVTLAEFFGLTKQRIHQLVAEGLPRELRGKYDRDKCTRWYIAYLQAAIEKRAVPIADGEGLYSEAKERTRKIKLEADLKEIELAKQRATLVAVEDVEKEFANLVLTTKARIMAVPARLAAEMLGLDSRVMAQAKIEKALKEALAQLASKGV